MFPKPIKVPIQYQSQMINNHPKEMALTRSRLPTAKVGAKQQPATSSIPGPKIISKKLNQPDQGPAVSSQSMPLPFSDSSSLKKGIKYSKSTNKPATDCHGPVRDKIVYFRPSSCQVEKPRSCMAPSTGTKETGVLPSLSNKQLGENFTKSASNQEGKLVQQRGARTTTSKNNLKGSQIDKIAASNKVQKLSNDASLLTRPTTLAKKQTKLDISFDLRENHLFPATGQPGKKTK